MVKFKEILAKFPLKSLKNDGLITDSLYMIFSNIYSKGMTYAFYLLTAYILGTSGFGTLRGILPLIDVLTIFFCSGIPPSIAKHISENSYFVKDQENVKKGNDTNRHAQHSEWLIDILKIMLIFSILGAFIVVLSKYILGGGYSNIDISTYLFAGVIIISSSFISWIRGILQGMLMIKELSKTWIIEHTFKIVFVIFFAYLYGVSGALLSISMAYIIGGVFGYHLLNKRSFIMSFEFNHNYGFNYNFGNNSNNNSKHVCDNNGDTYHNKNRMKIIKSILYYAIPIALGTASYRLLNDLDSMFIMSMLGAYDNGIYGYASLLSRGVFLFASAISIPLIPRIAKTRDYSYFKKALLMNTLIVLPVVAMTYLFSKEFLTIFFNIHDTRAYECLKILSISAGFMSSYTICSSSLQGLGYAKISLYVLLFGITVNAILDYILISNFGILGGAYATLISSICIFATILLYTITHKNIITNGIKY